MHEVLGLFVCFLLPSTTVLFFVLASYSFLNLVCLVCDFDVLMDYYLDYLFSLEMDRILQINIINKLYAQSALILTNACFSAEVNESIICKVASKQLTLGTGHICPCGKKNFTSQQHSVRNLECEIKFSSSHVGNIMGLWTIVQFPANLNISVSKIIRALKICMKGSGQSLMKTVKPEELLSNISRDTIHIKFSGH